MSGTLYIVATPIGNLEDITLRALRVLREVSLIAAEDTRRTAKLLQHYSISTPTTSLHGHNERRKVPALLTRLQEGDSLAVVTDAGTPAISDPGGALATAARAAGIRLEVVPGPSAVLTALVGSGFPTGSFCFAGFPPSRSNDRSKWLEGLAGEARIIVFFEAPHRIRATLEQAGEIWGDREITVARELTKVHEEWVKGPISAVLKALKNPRGEFTVVVGPAQKPKKTAASPLDDRAIWEKFRQLTNNTTLSRRECVSLLASRYGSTPRKVYAAIERAKDSGE